MTVSATEACGCGASCAVTATAPDEANAILDRFRRLHGECRPWTDVDRPETPERLCKGCGHLRSVHLRNPPPLKDVCLMDDCPCDHVSPID